MIMMITLIKTKGKTTTQIAAVIPVCAAAVNDISWLIEQSGVLTRTLM